jgi:hypothetical protein
MDIHKKNVLNVANGHQTSKVKTQMKKKMQSAFSAKKPS